MQLAFQWRYTKSEAQTLYNKKSKLETDLDGGVDLLTHDKI